MYVKRFTPSPQLMKNLLLLTLIGAVVTVIGIVFVPQRTWASLLLANYYILGIGVAAVVFIALLYVSNAGWATAIRRVPESMTAILPASGIVMLLTMLGIHSLYEWSHSDVVANDHMLQEKSAWLNVPFFVIRTVVYLSLWIGFAFAIVNLSRKQDESGDIKFTKRSKTASAIFLVVFGLTFTLASMDWIMSLEPHWYSTIFGIYNFSGSFLNGLAVITLVVLLLKRMGPFEHLLTEQHLHSLGKLIFAFSTFWMYIWFSQYMLIWYSNIPEEVTYMVNREKGSWLIFTIINVLFNWAIPFIALLPAWTKMREGFLLRVCIIIMIGHWIDLFWMILPTFMPEGPALNVWELGP
ncbi:MAG: hypothetical protein HYZ34_03190, partial [Ignavibacteriae bacterium]|nr:hypothetical protein [Ignavibacteriota bacterium]